MKRVASAAGKVALAGSRRNKPEGALAVGKIEPREPIVVTLYLQNPQSNRHAQGSAADLAELAQPRTRRSFARHRATYYAPAFAVIAKFAKKRGLKMQAKRADRRCVALKGSAERMQKAFGASLRFYEQGQHRFRARTGSLHLPPSIARWTRAILGFDQRPVRLQSLAGNGAGPGLWPSEVAALYGIPRDQDGANQSIGIVALGGGFLLSDLQAAAQAMGRPVPQVVEISVDGAANGFGGGTTHDEEIALDMQVIAGVVGAAKIVVYFAQNTTASLANAIHTAVFDDVHRPQVLSISWGSAEKFWKDGPREAVQAALADAVQLKVTVTAASGDLLATGGVSDGDAHVFFPASSPYVLGCGGTKLELQSNIIADETVWNEGSAGTGGGISTKFEVPAYQANVQLPPSANAGASGRGVPDIAAAADRTPGYRIVLGGNEMVKDGTSAVAPLWAGIIALANARRGAPVGLVNPFLYGNPSLLRSVLHGDNRADGKGYYAGPGWNACTGLGTPRGAEIIAALSAIT
jgi:kumamolisin